jgi:uncharacterized protein YjdB
MERKMQRKRFLASLITFIFLLSFLAISPGQDALAASNLVAGKVPSESSSAFKDLSFVTDGIKSSSIYADGYPNKGVQWIQMDLGTSQDVNNIKLWHYFDDARKYHDVIVQLSNDSTFSTGVVTTVFNNDTDESAGLGLGKDSEYAETGTGLNITFNTVNARYVRFYSNGSTANDWNHYVEIEIYGGQTQTGNLAADKSVTSSTNFTNISRITDSNMDTDNYSDGYPNQGLQWVQIDLGASQDVSNIKLWHYFGDARKYHDVIVQLSNDSTFSTGVVTTVFNNDEDESAGLGLGKDSEYAETSTGLNITFNTVNARYARFYSSGSTANNWNHYVEIEIYGGQTQTGNLAAWKSVTSSTNFTNISRITDSTPDTYSYADGYPNQGLQWVQIDLGASQNVNNIKLFHYFGDARTYHDVIVQLSNDSKFETGVTTVFNNDMDDTAGLGLGAGKDIEYAETSTGKDIPVGSLDARYVRFYSNGSTANAWNHYVETEVFGSEAAVIHPTSVDLNKTTDSIEIGATDKLTPIFTPAETTNKNVTWVSSDSTIASVSTDGTVTGVKAGTAKITVTTEDGGFTKDCVVTVPTAAVHATKITLNTDSASLIEAKLLTLKVVEVEPADATDKTVTWSTDNKNVATVSSKGVVTGVNPGTAVIIAKSADVLSSAAATCTVTVTTGKLLDDKTVYANDKDDLENIYITIPTGNTVTFDQVNAWNIDSTYVKPEMNVRFDYGTPATDTTGVVGNAVIAQRGQWCTYSQLKSYKIELNSGAALWKGQSKVLINKHPWDLSKIRNKLAFDLMKLFPDTFSARDQFCHVYIRNLNSSDKSYQDYGLFTQVEDVGKAYLETRGIEKTMYMYKPQDFEFKLNPALKNVTDPGYSLTEFEKVAEVKGIEDHTRFLEMLNAVNDQTNDINAVITKYFDRDNYIAWLATNCLLSNTDTTSSNFYLFSPVDQDKWYFIPWDYDDSLGYTDQLGADSSDIPSWKKDGVEMYAEVVLHRRFLKDPKNVADLSAKIEQLSAIATKSLVTQKVQTFYNTTNSLVTRNPDLLLITDPDEIGTDTATYRAEINRLPSVLDNAKQAYYTGLQKPMPVLLNEVQQSGRSCTFSWDSFDLQGNSLTYHFVISTDINFSNIVSDRNNLTSSSLAINLNPGTYYWKVTATDSEGHSQICTSVIYRENADDVYGVKQVVIQ